MWLISATLGLLLMHGTALAHSGCCSHHGGVVGCGCGDGTSLSSTCAPYYPECKADDSTYQSPSYSIPVPTTEPSCPTGQHFDVNTNVCACPSGMKADTSGICKCQTGFALAPTNTYCFKLTTHSHADKANTTDGWLCDAGYMKQGESCIKTESSISSTVASKKTIVKKSSSSSSVKKVFPIRK